MNDACGSPKEKGQALEPLSEHDLPGSFRVHARADERRWRKRRRFNLSRVRVINTFSGPGAPPEDVRVQGSGFRV